MGTILKDSLYAERDLGDYINDAEKAIFTKALKHDVVYRHRAALIAQAYRALGEDHPRLILVLHLE